MVRQLLGKKFAFFGLLGSAAKIEEMQQSLEKQGFSKEELAKIHAPVGLKIGSQTPMEIAVSIAAQIISLNAEC